MAAARCCSCWMLSWVCLGEGTSTEPGGLSREGFSIANILQRHKGKCQPQTCLVLINHHDALSQTMIMKTNLLSGSASTSSSALQVALESLSEWCSLPPWSPFSPLSLISGSILTWTSPLFMSTSWGSVLGCTEPEKEAALASWDPVSLSGLFSSLTHSSAYEGSRAFPLPDWPLSWSEHWESPAVLSALLESPDFEESAWVGEGALSVSELLSPPGEEWEVII